MHVVDMLFTWDGDEINYKITSWPSNSKKPKLQAAIPYVKHLTISAVDWSELLKGKIAQTINKRKYKNLVFPSAHMLTINVNGSMVSEAVKAGYGREHLVDLAKFVKHLVPSVCEIRVGYRPPPVGPVSETGTLMLLPLLQQLYTTVTVVRFVHDSTIPATSLDNFPSLKLTHVDCRLYRGSESLVRLIKQNSGSLVRLNFRHILPHYLTMIVEDVTYKHLHVLNIDTSDPGKNQRPGLFPSNVVPFPRLQRLSVDPVYPYDDDVLFRGNHNTLEQLCVPFTSYTMAIFAKYQVFDQQRYGRLKLIKVDNVHEFGERGLAEDSSIPSGKLKQQIYNVLNNTETFYINNPKDTDIIKSMFLPIDLTPSISNLQQVSFGRMPLHLGRVLDLVRCLPNLVHLACDAIAPIVLDNTTELEYSICQRTSFRYSLEKPLNRNLRSLTCPGKYHSNYSQSIDYVFLLLATTCPEFTFSSVPSSYGDGLRSTVYFSLSEHPFGKYQEYLKSLFEES